MHVGVDAGLRAGDQPERCGDRHAVDAHLAVSGDPRQLCLSGGSQLGDAVQVEGPAARRRDGAVGGDRFEVRRQVRRGLPEQQPIDTRRVAGVAVHGHKWRRGRPSALMELAGNAFHIRTRLCRDERAAVERRGAPDQLLYAHDCRRAARELHRALGGPNEPRSSRIGQDKWICHGLNSVFESVVIQLRPVAYRRATKLISDELVDVRDNERLNMTQTTISVNRDTATDRVRYSTTEDGRSVARKRIVAVFTRDEPRDSPCSVSAGGVCIDTDRGGVSGAKLVRYSWRGGSEVIGPGAAGLGGAG